jgi:hypothetical protein
VRRWTLYVCERGHVCGTTLRAVCWQCFPGGRGPATQQAVRVVPLSEVKEALLGEGAKEALLRLRESRHVDPPERGSEDWQCWEGDAEEDLQAIADAAFPSTGSEGQG